MESLFITSFYYNFKDSKMFKIIEEKRRVGNSNATVVTHLVELQG